MRSRRSFAATAFVSIVAAWLITAAPPAGAQYAPAPGAQVAPVCANCHEAQWKAIDLTAHEPGRARFRQADRREHVAGEAGAWAALSGELARDGFRRHAWPG